MKRRLPAIAWFGLFAAVASAADRAQPAQVSFCVSGVECASCVYVIQQALAETRGVAEVEVIQMLESEAKVSFDPAVISEHQIAQAVREAIAIHGTPYLTTLKLRIQGYSRAAHAGDVARVFARWERWVKIEPVEKREGEFVIHFLPLEKDVGQSGPKGWSLAQLTRALKAPAPEGLGLDFEIVSPAP